MRPRDGSPYAKAAARLSERAPEAVILGLVAAFFAGAAWLAALEGATP
jgi:hypothetical protein